MLAAITLDERGAADRLLMRLARDLTAQGLPLAGAVQENRDQPGQDKPQMVLHLLPGFAPHPITQDLGPLAGGCTLDTSALEQAAARAESHLPGARAAIVNKFGKRELEGRGFRPFIASAIAADVPVLLAVSQSAAEGFAAFAGGMECWLPPDPATLKGWLCDPSAPAMGRAR